MMMRRRNPFLAKPQYFGQSARLKSWEGGFHTTSDFNFAVPYAQLKWNSSPFGSEDAPVILEIDMTGFRAMADIDARRACIHVVTNSVDGVKRDVDSVDKLPLDELFGAWSYDAEFNQSEPDYTPERGDSVQNALFVLASASSHWASIRVAQETITTIEDFTLFLSIFLKLRQNENAALSEEEDAFLISVFNQSVYWNDISDDRLLAVYYMQPYFGAVVREDELEEDFEEDEEYGAGTTVIDYLNHGYEFVTDGDYSLRPSVKKVWVRPEPSAPLLSGLRDEAWKRRRVEYHGTSLSNLLSALPWLAEQLPRPQSPFDGSMKALMLRIKREARGE